MNLGLVHPYIYYLNIFIFTIFISGGSQGSEFVSNFATNLIKMPEFLQK